jgi:hypothetical protein
MIGKGRWMMREGEKSDLRGSARKKKIVGVKEFDNV